MAELRIERDGGIATLVVAHPGHCNALTLAMMQALPRLLTEVGADPQVHVVVIRGEGSEAFVSGGDISEFESARATRALEEAYTQAVDAAFDAPVQCPKPVVAAIRGFCMGGGLQLAAGCDIRLAADDAAFAMPAARLGVGYGFRGIERFVQILGPAATAEIFFTGRRFDAAGALRMGFVHAVLPVNEFDGAVRRYCEGIARNAPLTIAAAKAAINEALRQPAQRDPAALQSLLDRCWNSRDFREGRDAFLAKRPARFEGR